MTMITGSQIDLFRLKVLEKGLKLEILGMTRRGRSCYSIIKEEFGLRGSKAKVHEQFKALIEAAS